MHTDIYNAHDTSFAVCLFPVANDAVVVQKWQQRVRVMVSVAVWVSCRWHVCL